MGMMASTKCITAAGVAPGVDSRESTEPAIGAGAASGGTVAEMEAIADEADSVVTVEGIVATADAAEADPAEVVDAPRRRSDMVRSKRCRYPSLADPAAART